MMLKKYVVAANMVLSLSAVCMDASYKVATIDNGKVLGVACKATFVNFSRGYNLYYPILEAQQSLFEEIANKVKRMSVAYLEYSDSSQQKIVSGNLSNLGILVYALYQKNKALKLPNFISKSIAGQSIALEDIKDDVPEGGILIVKNDVFCNRAQFEWVKKNINDEYQNSLCTNAESVAIESFQDN